MSDNKHTPGPWTVGSESGYNIQNIYHGEDAVASVYGLPLHTRVGGIEPDRYEEPLANAQLIAAAPDMLEAMKAAFYSLVGLRLAHDVAANGWEWPDDAPDQVHSVWEMVRAAIAKAEGK